MLGFTLLVKYSSKLHIKNTTNNRKSCIFVYIKKNTLAMIIRLFSLTILILCSCSQSKKEAETIRVSILRGPSAIAFSGWIENAPVLEGQQFSIRFVDSPDIMQANLIKGETDIAVLPMISAVNLYNKGIHYSLIGCPVWGTLYIIGKHKEMQHVTNKPVLHIFGAGTTPDILTRHYLEKQDEQDYILNYSFSTAQEIMQGLLAGKIETAVLGEPFLSMVLNKDSSFYILADLNNPGNSSPGFPQTAVVCSPSFSDKKELIGRLLQQTCYFANERPEEAIRIVESKRVFKQGTLTPESIQRCKIKYRSAMEAKEDISSFLKIIEQFEPKVLGDKLPDKSFYK